MARLARLRLVNVGYPDARFDDLTLDFRDGRQRACDAVIWLRNAGGKSSILNLFFALVRPHRDDFLGGVSAPGAARRKLDDYVLEGDRAVVIAEWELDEGVGPRRTPRGADEGTWLNGLADPVGKPPTGK